MKVLDGRDSNKVPKIIEISEFIITDKWTDESENKNIYCLQLDGKFVPCVSDNSKRYKYVLCAAYKTRKGVEKWVARFHEHAKKEA